MGDWEFKDDAMEKERELEEEQLVSPQFHLARDREINLPLCVMELSIVTREREAR